MPHSIRRTMDQPRRGLGILLASTLFAALAPAGAELHPNDARGFLPGLSYQQGEVDQVSLFNGNLSVTVPIGPRFPLDGGLSYGLALVYNSKLWDFAKEGHPRYLAGRKLPNPKSTAGLGWSLSLGRLYAPNTPENDSTTQWLYVGPDGAEHFFHDSLHSDVPMPGAQYTRDGTYLRMRLVATSPDTREIEFPDGTIHRFPEASGYRLTQIRNRYPVPSSVDVSYATPGQWTISDSAGRVHRVYLTSFPYGDQSAPAETAAMVTRVELAAFGPHPATYDFVYTQHPDLVLPCAGTDPVFAGPISVPQLAQVKLPDDDDPTNPNDPQSAWSFLYYEDEGVPGPGACKTGALRQVELPTLGSVTYDYQIWQLPVVDCAPGPDIIPYPWRDSTGIASRTVAPGFGQPGGVWSYEQDWSAELTVRPAGYCPGMMTGGEIPREAQIVTVTSPPGDQTRHHFSVWPHPVSITSAGFSGKDFGLPFTRYHSDGGGGSPRFLSTESCEGMCVPIPSGARRSYVRYERDEGPCSSSCQDTNRRLASRKTVFADDGGTFTVTDLSDFDGLGHYRVETSGGDFVAGHVRTVTTDWNSGRGTYPGSWIPPAATDPWVLETFPTRKVQETDVPGCASGSSTQTAWQELCFDAATGFLSRERTLVSGAATLTRGGADVLHVYQQAAGNANGNVRFEGWYGGDGGTLPNLPICAAGLLSGQTPAYRMVHEHQSGVRSRSRFTDADDDPGNDGGDAAFAFWTLDQTIDADSGLPSSSREVSGLETVYEHDRLGRLTAAKPSASHGGAWLRRDYPRAAGSTPAKLIERAHANGVAAGTPMAESQVVVDGLGRPTLERRRFGAGGGDFDERATEYDALGRESFVSEWGRTNLAQYGVERWGMDIFGRPAALRRHAGAVPSFDEVTFFYVGARTVSRTLRVGTTASGPNGVLLSPVTTTDSYDHHGRLVRVEEPSTENLTTMVSTSYGYDVGNRLKRSFTDPAGSSADQTRCFDYDRRGFLLSEKHPEKGASGDGTVTYGLFDALGKPGLRTDGPVTLESLFDRAGRMTLQFEPSAGNRNWKRYVYGSSNVGGPSPNWKLGKVERAIGYNYLPGSPGLRVRFEEDFVYSGPGGRASGRTVRRIDNVLTTPLGPDLDSEVFTHAESFDALGQRISVTYPTCVPASANCDAGSASPRTVTSTYAFGRLTSVPGWVSQITYHPNGSWNQFQHANGVTDLQGMGDDRRPRPASLETKRATTTLWRAGTFAYDDAGNLLTMGPTEHGGIDRFLYDGVSRLREARLYIPEGESPDLIFADGFESGDTSAWGGTAPLGFAGETARTRRFRYDVHANLIEVEEVGGSTLNLPTDSTSNRLLAPLATYSDGRGNQTSHGPTQFAYDALDRMASRTAGGTTTYFGYTADGERIVSYVAQENDFHWALRDLGGKLLRTFGLEELTEEPPTIALRPRWDHLFAGDRAIGAEAPLAPPGTARIHQSLDHLGTPRLLTDAAGNVRPNGRHKYLPYGEDAVTPTTQTGPTLAFTGHERDFHDTTGPEDDLDYLHARFRSPLTGRFLSVDPVLQVKRAMKMPQLWNRYSYALGNPLIFTDPTGETVYLVTYTTGNTEGDEEFRRAALTQAAAIRAQEGFDPETDTVLVRGVETKSDFAAALKEASGLEATFGKVGQVSLFSHAGPVDGPTFHTSQGASTWLRQTELRGLDVNRESGAKAYFYGCNTALNFAGNFARAQGVSTYGHTGSSFPSSDPNRRVPPGQTGPVYFVQAQAAKSSLSGALNYLLGQSFAVPMTRVDP